MRNTKPFQQSQKPPSRKYVIKIHAFGRKPGNRFTILQKWKSGTPHSSTIDYQKQTSLNNIACNAFECKYSAQFFYCKSFKHQGKPRISAISVFHGKPQYFNLLPARHTRLHHTSVARLSLRWPDRPVMLTFYTPKILLLKNCTVSKFLFRATARLLQERLQPAQKK